MFKPWLPLFKYETLYKTATCSNLGYLYSNDFASSLIIFFFIVHYNSNPDKTGLHFKSVHKCIDYSRYTVEYVMKNDKCTRNIL